MRLVQIWNEVCGYPAPSMTPWQFVMTVILYIWSTSSSVCDNQQTYTSSQDIKKGPELSVYPPAALMHLTGWENVKEDRAV